MGISSFGSQALHVVVEGSLAHYLWAVNGILKDFAGEFFPSLQSKKAKQDSLV